MTMREAIRILDPETTREAIAEIEYYAGFKGREAAIQAVDDACRIACDVMRRALKAQEGENNDPNN